MSTETISKESRKALRNKKVAASANRGGIPMSKGWIPFYGCVFGIGAFSYAITAENEMGKSMRNSDAWKWVVAQYQEVSRPFSEPNAKKLLPDWPYFPNTPPGTPCPPTLVLDLEGTLCTSTWDHKFGWRHVKRPGVEKFLREMARYYEIVIFTSNIAGTAEPIIMALDKDNVVIHRLYREATKFQGGVHIKDLSALNRDLKKVIIVDDDPKAFQLQPSNAIHVPTFKNAMDKSDTTLEDLTPFLAALVNEGVNDFPELISKFPSNESNTISQIYNQKLTSIKENKDQLLNRGLGGLLRTVANKTSNNILPEDSFVIENEIGSGFGPNQHKISRIVPKSESKTLLNNSKQNTGPLVGERKGGLWKTIDSLKSEAEEVNRKKMEAFQEVMMKKERERQENASDMD
jgi:import inner membrane translocase subunit TIM50